MRGPRWKAASKVRAKTIQSIALVRAAARAARHGKPPGRSAKSLLQFRGFVSDAKQAKRYFVSGLVQGVGYRFFAQRVAEKLRLGGYAKNLADGRVEVFAMGTPWQLAELKTALERGPRFSSVSEVREEIARPDPLYEKGFVIN